MMWHVGELLIKKKLITWDQLEVALDEQKKTRELVGEILIRKGFVPRQLFFKTLAEQHQMRFIDLRRTRINPKAVQLIPSSIAHKYRIMPIEIADEVLIIGIPNPLMVWPQEEVRQLANIKQLQTVLCLPEDIDLSFKEYYGKNSA